MSGTVQLTEPKEGRVDESDRRDLGELGTRVDPLHGDFLVGIDAPLDCITSVLDRRWDTKRGPHAALEVPLTTPSNSSLVFSEDEEE